MRRIVSASVERSANDRDKTSLAYLDPVGACTRTVAQMFGNGRCETLTLERGIDNFFVLHAW
jgi:hypothetical protein